MSGGLAFDHVQIIDFTNTMGDETLATCYQAQVRVPRPGSLFLLGAG